MREEQNLRGEIVQGGLQEAILYYTIFFREPLRKKLQGD